MSEIETTDPTELIVVEYMDDNTIEIGIIDAIGECYDKDTYLPTKTSTSITAEQARALIVALEEALRGKSHE